MSQASPGEQKPSDAGGRPSGMPTRQQIGTMHASVLRHIQLPPMQSHSREGNVSPQHVSVPSVQEEPSSEH